MHIDHFGADEGYFALYVDGVRQFWGRADPMDMLASVADGKPHTFSDHGLGNYGYAAVEWGEPAARFSDIPAQWWTNDPFTPPSFEDEDL